MIEAKLLLWAHQVKESLQNGDARFSKVCTKLKESWGEEAFDALCNESLQLFLLGEETALAFSVHLRALFEYGSKRLSLLTFSSSLEGLLLGLAKEFSERGVLSFYKILQLYVLKPGDGFEAVKSTSLLLVQKALDSEECLNTGTVPPLTLACSKIVLLLKLDFAHVNLKNAWRFLRATVQAKHWGSVTELLVSVFSLHYGERDRAIAFALNSAGDSRAGQVLSSLREASSRPPPLPSSSFDSGPGTATVSASSAVSVFFVRKGKSTPTHHPSFHPLAQNSFWAVPFSSGGFSTPHPSLLSTSASSPTLSPKISDEAVSASSLVDLISQGHKRAPPGFHSAVPIISSWKQRSLRHALVALNDLQIACRLALGDSELGVWLWMYLQKLGRRKDAELVRLALGLSIGRGNDQVELMEDKATESGMGERLSNTVEDHSTLWSVPLLFKGAAETPQGDKIPSVGAFFTMVMEASGFSLMCRELLEELTEEKKRILLGVDTEHRPEGLYCGELKGFSHSYPLSLLQLATLRRVWLVDLLSIEKNGGVGEEYSKMFCDEILGRSQFVKVGWGIRDDFRRLFHSHGHWLSVGRTATSHVTASACGGGGSGTTGGTAGGTEGMKVEGVVDLAAVARLCFTPAPNSLSSLIQLSLGHPLCKKMQTSDWQLRPLSWEQLKYAALDALSSVHACERLQKEHIYKDGWGGEKSGVMLGETHFFSSCSQSATPPPHFPRFSTPPSQDLLHWQHLQMWPRR